MLVPFDKISRLAKNTGVRVGVEGEGSGELDCNIAFKRARGGDIRTVAVIRAP